MYPEHGGVSLGTIMHELAHRWDENHNFNLSNAMTVQRINGTIEGPPPTDYATNSNSSKEDFADSVSAYFAVNSGRSGFSYTVIEDHNWSDDDPLNKLGLGGAAASPDSAYTKDRYDYMESLFKP